LKHHSVTAISDMKSVHKIQKTVQLVTGKWKFHFTVTSLNMAKFYKMAKCVFSWPAH